MPKEEAKRLRFNRLVDEIADAHINLGLAMQGMISALKLGDCVTATACISKMAEEFQTLGNLLSELRNQSDLVSPKDMEADGVPKELANRLSESYHILRKKPHLFSGTPSSSSPLPFPFSN